MTIKAFHNTSGTGANAFCKGTFKRGFDRKGGWRPQELAAIKKYELGDVTPPIYFSLQPSVGEKKVPVCYGDYAVEVEVDFNKGFFTYAIGDSSYAPMQMVPSGVNPEEFLLGLYNTHVLNGKAPYVELHWWADELPSVVGVWKSGEWDLRGCVFTEYQIELNTY